MQSNNCELQLLLSLLGLRCSLNKVFHTSRELLDPRLSSATAQAELTAGVELAYCVIDKLSYLNSILSYPADLFVSGLECLGRVAACCCKTSLAPSPNCENPISGFFLLQVLHLTIPLAREQHRVGVCYTVLLKPGWDSNGSQLLKRGMRLYIGLSLLFPKSNLIFYSEFPELLPYYSLRVDPLFHKILV